MTTTDQTTTPITPDDLEAKFTELQTGIETATSSARAAAGKVALVALVVLAIAAYILGKRRGQASKTVVEVRRL